MQIQNSNVNPAEAVYEKLLSISDDIVSHSIAGRPYRMRGRLGEAYTLVFEQCTGKPGKSENMFNKYKELLTLHFVSYVKSANIQYDAHVFRETNKFWTAYIQFASLLTRHVFPYLDRYFLPAREFGNLIDVAVAIFDKNVFGNEAKRQIYIRCFAEAIRTMRAEMIVTQNNLYEFMRQLYPINTELYYEMKKVYLEETKAFYEDKLRQLHTLHPLYFYNSIANLIYFEETLSNVCLYWTNDEMVKERLIMPIIFAKELIEPYTPIFLAHSNGLLWALRCEHIPLLNLVTDIYSRFEGFDKIKKCYYDFIVEESRQLVQSLENVPSEHQALELITKFFSSHQSVLSRGFKKHQQMHVTLSNALEFGVGKWEKLPDILFKFTEKVVAEGGFEANAPTIKSIFEKISSKDQFIHKCERWIQAIILNEKIPIQELSKFATFLHELCGSENTHKLSKLVSDYIEENQGAEANGLACKVISHHLWEWRFKEEVAVCLTLPQRLEDAWTVYLNAYSAANSKKRLQLLPLSSTLMLTLHFNSTHLTVKCNLLQASILFSLLEQPKTEEELMLHINTEKHLINSFLASAKFVVQRAQKLVIDWDFQEGGEKDFTEQFEEKSKFIKAIEQDRNILLEAGIVRMMKRSKEASFEEIFDALCHSIKLFRPQPHMVKTTLEKLIRRDFVETNEQGLYIYKE